LAIIKAHYPSPLGEILGAAEDGKLVGLWFRDEHRFIPAESDDWPLTPGDALLQRLGKWLAAYFAGENPAIDFPLEPRGSDFRQAVWRYLREIAYGDTTTYGTIAKQIAAEQQRSRPPAAQAVGGAVGHNPISIVIPCHRVVGAGGNLTGYGGGLWRKTALLQLEGVLPAE
jgi:methylated-DNA-[protein]-cysteine S-methyltransferase